MKKSHPIVCVAEYFEPADPQRRAEVKQSLTANLSNPHIDELHLFSEPGTELPGWVRSGRLVHHPDQPRLTFRRFLEFSSDPSTTYILSNLDIELGDTIGRVRHVQPREVWALTRWEGPVAPDFLGRASQDTWVIRGGKFPVHLIHECDFPLGVPGCDNAFAGRMEVAGWRVLNPCYSIRTYHHHTSMVRTYLPEERIPRPYLHPDPQGFELALACRSRGIGPVVLTAALLVLAGWLACGATPKSPR